MTNNEACEKLNGKDSGWSLTISDAFDNALVV